MINYKEFYQKFSRIFGSSNSEVRLSLEIFSKLISQRLELGDKIEIKSLGYFAYKKVKPIDMESNEYPKVILFSEEIISKRNKDLLIFFLPDESQREFPHIDSYLNLSLGKTLISSEEINDNQFILSSPNYELIGLLESKAEKLFADGNIFKSTDQSEQEFVLPSVREEILFDTGTAEESDEETKVSKLEEESDSEVTLRDTTDLKTFKDFELVEADKIELIDVSGNDAKEKVQWELEDLNIQNGFEKSVEATIDGYSEVKAPLAKSIISNSKSEKGILGKPSKGGLASKSKKSSVKKLVPAIFGLLIISAIAAGIYLNYDKIKSYLNIENDKSQVGTIKENVEPIIIARTFEFPVTYPYQKDELFVEQTPDSVILSPVVFIARQNIVEPSSSKVEAPVNDMKQNPNELVRVRNNIYQRGTEFLIQASSWKSKSKAEKELKKYIDNGISAELIAESSSSVGKYLKVMIGGFKSFDEANDFLNKNK